MATPGQTTTNIVTTSVTPEQRDAFALARKNGTPLDKIKTYAKLPDIQERFINMLGQREGRAYLESVIIAVANSDALQECSPKSIMISAMRAASLRLSVDPTLHQAHIVPFGKEATLIVDYHGLCQLTEATGNYLTPPNVSEVYQGEIVKVNRFTGVVEISGIPNEPRAIQGWVGYFKLRNGIERYLYMTNEECDAHGKKYSKAYNSPRSGWNTDREKMRRKTVLRLLVSRWAPFSPAVDRILRQDEEAEIAGEVTDMPDDSNIVAPKMEMDQAQIMNDLGFGSSDPRAKSEIPSPGYLAHDALKDIIDAYVIRHPTATASDKERKVLASTVDAIFNGEKTMRYELFRYVAGEASTMKMQPARVMALLDKLEVSDFNQPPAEDAVTMFRAAHTQVLKAQGQQVLIP